MGAVTRNAGLAYLNTFVKVGSHVYKELHDAVCMDFTLVAISGLEWDYDMAPWDIPPISKGDTPCTGGADEYLQLLIKEIVPRAKKFVQGRILWRGTGGVFSCRIICPVFCLSDGTFFKNCQYVRLLVVPGFKEYVFSHEMKSCPEHLYLSLGDRECKTRNPYLKTVQEHTEEIKSFYIEEGIDTVLQFNPGNHYKDTVQRTAAGIAWIRFIYCEFEADFK